MEHRSRQAHVVPASKVMVHAAVRDGEPLHCHHCGRVIERDENVVTRWTWTKAVYYCMKDARKLTLISA